MKKYITVAGPKNIETVKGDVEPAMNHFSNIMNEYAQQGWEYHSMESIAVTNKPGCFKNPITTYYYMLIFSKDV
jgi:hypothetical protein